MGLVSVGEPLSYRVGLVTLSQGLITLSVSLAPIGGCRGRIGGDAAAQLLACPSGTGGMLRLG